MTTDFREIGRVEVTAALELVLDRDTSLSRKIRKDFMVVGAFLESIEPHEGADHENEEPVNDENPVKEVKTEKNMVWLHDCANGNDPRHKQDNAKDETR